MPKCRRNYGSLQKCLLLVLPFPIHTVERQCRLPRNTAAGLAFWGLGPTHLSKTLLFASPSCPVRLQRLRLRHKTAVRSAEPPSCPGTHPGAVDHSSACSGRGVGPREGEQMAWERRLRGALGAVDRAASKGLQLWVTCSTLLPLWLLGPFGLVQELGKKRRKRREGRYIGAIQKCAVTQNLGPSTSSSVGPGRPLTLSEP